MAYIATKATYIDEEEVKDDNSNVLQRRIITDVDDVVFNTGEVIVLLEEENKDKHFDLTIEDKGSKYFKPTQIKIGDGFHAFKELNWLQTFDPSRVESVVSNGVTAAASTIMGKFTDLDNKVTNFIEVDAGKILQELVKGRYFTLSDDVILSCFNTEGVSDDELKSFSIGYNNNFNYNGIKGKRSIIFGESNKLSGLYNHINGTYNTIVNNKYSIINGDGNKIENPYSGIQYCNLCLGIGNYIKKGGENVTSGRENNVSGSCNTCIGYTNIITGLYNTCFGNNNQINGSRNYAFGMGNIINDDDCFVCGRFNIGEGKIFAVGNGYRNAKLQTIIRQNAFDIDTSGKATFYGNLEVKGSLPNILCGNSCTNIGNYSYAGGWSTKSGAYSLSHGSNCNLWVTPGTNCACFGLSCDTPVNSSFACGQYNIGEGKIFSVGNGSNDEKNGITRSNAFDIDTSGKATFYRNLQCNNNLLVNGSLYSNNYIGLDKLNFLIEHNSTKKTAMTIDELGNSYIHGDLTIYGDITNEINYSHKMLNTLFKESDNNDVIYRNGFQIHTIGTPGIYTVFYFENSGTSTSNNYNIITDPILLPKNTYIFKYKTRIKDNIKIMLMNGNNVIAQIDNNSEYIDDYVELEIKIDNPKEVRMVIEPIKFNENKPDITNNVFYLSLINKEQNNSITDEIALLKYDIEMLKNK